MYIVENKKQLHDFCESIRTGIELHSNASLRPSRFKELMASCINQYDEREHCYRTYRSYAALLSAIHTKSNCIDDYTYCLIETLHKRLISHPYSIPIDLDTLNEIFEESHRFFYWDDQASYESILAST